MVSQSASALVSQSVSMLVSEWALLSAHQLEEELVLVMDSSSVHLWGLKLENWLVFGMVFESDMPWD